MRVSLVEDNQEIRRRLRLLLSEVPNARLVSEADRASQAIAQLPRCRPHLVIVDLQLKEGTGLEVLDALRRSVSPPEIIVLTNLTDAAYRSRCAELGVSHFLSKSKGFERLRGLLVSLANELSAVPASD